MSIKIQKTKVALQFDYSALTTERYHIAADVHSSRAASKDHFLAVV